jgi:hypothetical protein
LGNFRPALTLDRVLHNAEKVQTEFDVERIRKAIPKYVQTSSYHKAMKILEEQRLVIISGVPGIGKTTLANVLLYAHLEAGYEPVVIQSSVVEGKALFRKDGHQIFYFDDFLGDTFLGNRLFDFLGKKEDSVVLDFMTMIAGSKSSRLIVTTREHILRHAFEVSERFRRQRLELAARRCILEVEDYTLLERGRILYNHIYFSDLPEDFRLELIRDRFYQRILRHPNFNPRLVEWLSAFTNVKGLRPEDYQAEVSRILDNPAELWRTAFEQQISEACCSVILALYSLGGKADLDQLEQAWTILHEYRAKKYNWKTHAEDWRRSLQDLEGGFLNFKDQHAQFVNPSVKDFLDTTVIRNIEHFNDLLSAASRFEQVVVLWSLAMSEKGEQLQMRVRKSPERLVSAMTQNLLKPHEQRVGPGGYKVRRLDVDPEVRLRTLISVADETRSMDALKAAIEYSSTIVQSWRKTGPRFQAATDVLRGLDSAEWSEIGESGMHSALKTALLSALEEWPHGDDLARMADYAAGESVPWTEHDRNRLGAVVDRYLEKEFWQELGDYGPDELEGLSDSLGTIGSCLGLDVTDHDIQVHERKAELESEEPDPDDDDRLPRNWDEAEGDVRINPEEEVNRLFDGLR